jgi:hypothetical protein
MPRVKKHKSGRPRVYPEGSRVSRSIYMKAATRNRIAAAAKRNKVSFSAEAATRLDQSFRY